MSGVLGRGLGEGIEKALGVGREGRVFGVSTGHASGVEKGCGVEKVGVVREESSSEEKGLSSNEEEMGVGDGVRGGWSSTSLAVPVLSLQLLGRPVLSLQLLGRRALRVAVSKRQEPTHRIVEANGMGQQGRGCDDHGTAE